MALLIVVRPFLGLPRRSEYGLIGLKRESGISAVYVTPEQFSGSRYCHNQASSEVATVSRPFLPFYQLGGRNIVTEIGILLSNDL